MMGEKVIEQRPVALAEVEELLGALKKDKELNYEQDIAEKYAKRFAPLTPTQAHKAREALEEIESLKSQPAFVAKVLDFLPVNVEMIETLAGKAVPLTPDETQAIIDVCKKYQKE